MSIEAKDSSQPAWEIELFKLRQLCREQHLALMWWKDFINDESAPIGNELIRKAIEKYNSMVSK